MKIRAITLSNVRRFTEPARIGDIGDGLNVLCEPNEYGKSTLFDAIQAVFFKAHGSRDKDVSALRPHAGGAPEVTIEIETEAGRFTIAKRWFQKPAATVHRGATLVAQSDAAEAWIADLLGDDAGGPSGLIWVRQGVTDLTTGSAKEQKSALDARRDLMTSVGEEVENLTGGRRMDMALRRCKAALDELATGKARAPKRGGPWKDAQERVESLSERRDTLAAAAADLHGALTERNRARRELRQIEEPEIAQARRDRLATAEAAHAEALKHAEALEAATRRVEMARLTAEKARDRLAALREATREHGAADQALQKATIRAEAAKRDLTEKDEALDSAMRALTDTRRALKEAEDTQRLAQRAKAARDGAERRRELQERIAAATEAHARMEEAATRASTGPDAPTLRRIEERLRAFESARAARDATATRITAHYAEGRAGGILLDGSALTDAEPVPLSGPVRLEIDGIGTLEIRPPHGGEGEDSVDKARVALRAALDAVDADTPEKAREAAAARAEASQDRKEAEAVFKSLAPAGLEALRKSLASIPVAEGLETAPDPDEADRLLDAARAAQEDAAQRQESAARHASDARSEAAGAQTALSAAQDRAARAGEALARLGDASEETRIAESDTAARALAEAGAARDEMARAAPDLTSSEAALKRARAVETQAQAETARLRPLLARLEERIGSTAGKAVEEELAETEEKLEAAQTDLARIEREVAVLIRLEAALEAARTQARERYFAPIARELKPLLHLLWPDAELTWGEDSLLPDALIREGRKEPISILSGGTQEQVALLVRLAFARMLAAAGRTAPVILDDALVFTDDDRIERMFDALHRQAGDLQIIVLTCRQRAFRDLGGQLLRIGPSPQAAG